MRIFLRKLNDLELKGIFKTTDSVSSLKNKISEIFENKLSLKLDLRSHSVTVFHQTVNTGKPLSSSNSEK